MNDNNNPLLPKFDFFDGGPKNPCFDRTPVGDKLKKLQTYIALVDLGLSQAIMKKLDPHLAKHTVSFGATYKKTPVKSSALGWFKDSLKGELIANVAYNIYCLAAPNNKDLKRQPKVTEILAAYTTFRIQYPFYLYEYDNVRGLEINRFFGLLEAIREHNTASGTCNKCSAKYIREASRSMSTCPHCAISSRGKKVYGT